MHSSLLGLTAHSMKLGPCTPTGGLGEPIRSSSSINKIFSP